jgi:fumarate reductase iron-sulfur subunit
MRWSQAEMTCFDPLPGVVLWPVTRAPSTVRFWRIAELAAHQFRDAAVRVRGDQLLGCAGNQLEIAPLTNLPVIKDLVTDMSEFFDKWAAARGQFQPTSTRKDDFARVRPDSLERQQVDAGIECIGCGVCYASCDVVTWNPAYLGPAAMNRAWTLVNDVRDGAGDERLAAVAGDAGCHACHTHMSCTERCPKKISPTAAIAGLKRVTLAALLKGRI